MQFENISIHCENTHIVESCEITAAVAHLSDEVIMLQNSADTLCYVLHWIFYLSMLHVVKGKGS